MALHLGVDPLDLVLVVVHRRSLGKYDAAKNTGIMGERNQIVRLWDKHAPLVDVLEGNGLLDLVQRTDLVVRRASFDVENVEAPVRFLLLPVNLNDVRADCCACIYINVRKSKAVAIINEPVGRYASMVSTWTADKEAVKVDDVTTDGIWLESSA